MEGVRKKPQSLCWAPAGWASMFPGTAPHWVLDNDLFKLGRACCSYSWNPTRQELCLEDLLKAGCSFFLFFFYFFKTATRCLSCGVPHMQTFPSSQAAHHEVLQSSLTSCTSVLMGWARSLCTGKRSHRLPLLCNPYPAQESCLREMLLNFLRAGSPPAFGDSPNHMGDRWETGKTWRGLLQALVPSQAENQKCTRRDLAQGEKGCFAPPFLCAAWHAGPRRLQLGGLGNLPGKERERTTRHLWGLSAHIWLHIHTWK